MGSHLTEIRQGGGKYARKGSQKMKQGGPAGKKKGVGLEAGYSQNAFGNAAQGLVGLGTRNTHGLENKDRGRSNKALGG